MTVEYEVPGLVDGVSPAPPFSYDRNSPLYKKPDADGIVRFSAAEMIAFNGGNLGLFDPDFGVGGTFADRFLHMVEVRTAGGGVAATIAVVDARDPALPGQEDVLAPSPEADFYSDDCIFVPQGSALAFAGFNPTPGQPVVIRINVVAWGSVEDYALLLRQCCCEMPDELKPPGPGSILTWGNSSIAAAADTRFLRPGFDSVTAGTVGVGFQSPRGGTFKNMFVRTNAAPGAANANVVSYRLRINGVDSSLVVTRAANAGIGNSSNLVNSVVVAQGDLVQLVAVKAIAIGSGVLVPIVSMEFA
jgi:hypothetical protein